MSTETQVLAIDEIVEERILPNDYRGRIGCRMLHDGSDIGVWIDAEWDGRSPMSALIAAAPKLLEACREVAGRLDNNGNFGMAGDPLVKKTLMASLHAAIAEAEDQA